MSNPNYIKGAAYERDFCKRMEALGYLPIRSAGSHSKIDVILFPLKTAKPLKANYRGDDGYELSPRMIKVCQLKRGSGNTKKEREEFANLPLDCAVHKLWVSREDRGKEKIEVIL